MANEISVTFVANVASDVDLRFTPNGVAVANFRLAQNPRDKQGDQWVDGEPTFFNCSAWRQLGENCAESLGKGMRVIVQGRMRTRTYETRDGGTGTSLDLNVEAIGPELSWAVASVQRTGGGARGQAAPQGDPWGSAPQGGGFGGGTDDSEPPF